MDTWFQAGATGEPPVPEREVDWTSPIEWQQAARACAVRLDALGQALGQPELGAQLRAVRATRSTSPSEQIALERMIEHVEWLLEKKAVPPPPAPPSLDRERVPAKLLMSWAQILNALDLPNDDTNRHLVRRLNSEHDGPLLSAGQGSQPKVNKAMLIEWWNRLEERFREIDERSRDKAATVDSNHEYGRSGIVVPEIGGSVKKRRSSRER